MARDNDKGLYLPLKIDLDTWEQSLMGADADLQKAMRKMGNEIKDLKLRYSVEIEGAKASGDYLKAMELETAQTNQLLEVQGQIVDTLAKKYESLSDKGTKEAKSIEKTLLAQQKVLYQMQNKVKAAKELKEKSLANTKKQFEDAMFNATASDYEKAIKRITDEKNAYIKNGIDKVNAEKLFAIQKEEINKKYLANIQEAQEKLNLKDVFGSRLSEALERNFPTFARFKNVLKSLNSDFEKLGYGSKMALTSIKALGVTGVAFFAGYKGLQAVTNNVEELAMAASEAAEPIYQLREELGSSYEEAELLHGIFAIDGGDARAFAASMNQMHRAMQRGNDETNLIAKTLRTYGVELRDATGNQKTVIEQLYAIAEGYQRAKAVGKQRDFLSGIGFSSNQYTHVLEGLENYIALAKQAQTEDKKEYQALHDLQDARNMVKESARNLAVVKGELYAPEHLEVLMAEVAANKGLAQYYKDARKDAENLVKVQGELALMFVDMNTAWDIFKAKAGGVAAEAVTGFRKALTYLQDTKIGKFLDEKIGIRVSYVNDALTEAESIRNQGRLQVEMDKIRQEEMAKARKAAQKKLELLAKEAEEAEKNAKLKKKYQDALFDATASDYEKEIKRISDKKQAFIDEGLSEVDAQRLFALQKEQIDQKYYEQRKQEEENVAKKVEDSYKKQLEASKRANEEAKRAREAAMSEAEQTLKNNIKLVRYMDKIKKQGGDYVTAGQQYAEKLYFKQAGFNRNDIGLLKDFGVNLVKEIANVRDRVFADFAQGAGTTNNNVTNNTTVNIDRPVLTDENLVNQLAGKILDKIAPLFQQPVSNNTL